ncbi:hypothetical protein PPACK8108_LOCUS14499 [Phakopsora pachyrhizi]|uniref:RING-type domain-containing protein n=2 Tax=Phakopsora pachyrhizi TaxID=170000 RepID=A0AAV0B742_PHAPC|nr:hypothetical protein PPACK8108_LOCUS14499 [Phakopsora pachyrhizi]
MKNEYQWIKKNARRLNELREEKEREDLLEEQERLNGALIECQCCFDEFTFTKILQCPEGHLFCHGCVRRNADVQIGDGKSIIACMDKSGCDSRFSYAELRKILSRQVLKKLDEIEMENSMDSAQIEGLEKCPFCPFAIIFESSDDKILRCSNEGCKKVSCRLCKMIDHSPKTCEEAKKDESDKSYHLVAEAMTSALIRNCPKCKKGFIKETGCNRITCPKCATVSCYICQKVIGGYTHFSNKANNIQVTSTGSKAMCPLWDDTGNRHYDEISKAHREAAIQIENTVNNLGPEDLSRIKPGPRPPATSYPNHH